MHTTGNALQQQGYQGMVFSNAEAIRPPHVGKIVYQWTIEMPVKPDPMHSGQFERYHVVCLQKFLMIRMKSYAVATGIYQAVYDHLNVFRKYFCFAMSDARPTVALCHIHVAFPQNEWNAM